jgi:triosephosphate isomerase
LFSVAISAQDCYVADGAFTGEVSAGALVDSGVNWTILGHSERRHVFGETDELLGKKLTAALAAGLHVIYCIGELEKERDEGRTNDVLATQLAPLFKQSIDWTRVVIAYEPVWAIGTGKNATPAIAQETHEFVRAHIAKNAGDAVAGAVRVLYGGSVKSNNCVELAACKDVDGFLVGGASLLADQFEAILKSRAAKL